MITRRFALAAMSMVFAAPVFAEAPFVEKTFDEACAEAKKADKLVLIDFYTTWCGPCKKLDRETWPDTDVKALLSEKFIAIKLDAEKDTKTAANFKIGSYPTVLLVKPSGDEIDCLVGFKPPKEMLSELKDAMAGKDSVARAKEKAGKQKGDPMARMQVGDALVQQGKHAEALEEYLWCFDHGNENSVGFYGVRLSFLLGSITRLGKQYPPALDALRQRRDTAAEAVRQAGSGNVPPRKTSFWNKVVGTERDPVFEKAHDLSSINRELGEDANTLALYDELRAKKTVNAQVMDLMFKEVLDELMKARRYDDVASAVKDVKAQIKQEIASFKEMEQYLKNAKMPAMEEVIASQRRNVVAKGVKFYEAFLGAHKVDQAKSVADQLLEFDASADTFEALVRAALRAKAKQEAAPLVARAKKELPADELKRILPTLERIPSDD